MNYSSKNTISQQKADGPSDFLGITQSSGLAIQTIMSEEKANQKARLKIPMERIRKYFPQGYTAAQIEDAVVKLCERDYRRRTDRER